VTHSQIVDRLGHTISDTTVFATCGIGPGAGKSNVFACLAAHGFRQIDSYQPVSRFWTFQGIESGLFLGLAAVLLGVGVFWVTRRSTA
jgi:hypothetical protein